MPLTARQEAVILATLDAHAPAWYNDSDWWGCEAHISGARTCQWEGDQAEFAAHQAERVTAALNALADAER